MDIKPYQDKFKKWFLKYRYVALIVLIGLIFLLIPGTADKEDSKPVVPAITEDDTPLYAELSDILSAVEGAGRVEVLLTVSQGEATVYQANTFSSTSGDSSEIRHEIITVSDAQRAQNGLIQQINPPTYLGAIVVCEGADSPSVRLALTEAVSKVTGLGADRISVLKMK